VPDAPLLDLVAWLRDSVADPADALRPRPRRSLIAVIDPKAGKLIEFLRPEKDEPIGNLLVHQDFLISQTLTEIAVFRSRRRSEGVEG
jgi:hypothetical protein